MQALATAGSLISRISTVFRIRPFAQIEAESTCTGCNCPIERWSIFCPDCGQRLPVAPSSRSSRVPLPQLVVGAHTHAGPVKQRNEDAILCTPIWLADGRVAQLCCVADGVSGSSCGDNASQVACEILQVVLRTTLISYTPETDNDWSEVLSDAFQAANLRIYAQSMSDATMRGMQTTMTTAIIMDDRAYIASVGDTRAYLVCHDGRSARQLTTDHTVAQRLIDTGYIEPYQRYSHVPDNVVYRTVGSRGHVEVDCFAYPLRCGQAVLLCSDGLTRYLTDNEIAQITTTYAFPQAAAEQLVTLVNERGGEDNISVVIARRC